MLKHQLQKNETLDEGVKKVATGLVQHLLFDLTCANVDRNMAIHNARKDCKMLRGLLRLVRPAMKEDFSTIDESIRNAALRLSRLRDSVVMAETLQRLRKPDRESVTEEEQAAIQSILAQPSAAGGIGQNVQSQIDAFLTAMKAILEQIPDWSFRKGLSEAARISFAKTYRRGFKRMKATRCLPSDANLHSWRKSVKYHEHQLRLLSSNWKGNAAKRIARLARLAQVLGDDHDLALIQEKLRASGEVDGGRRCSGVSQLLRVIANRRARLQARAFILGKRLYRQHPTELVKKLQRF
jgi:CHAD domain-containing protein